MTANRLRMIGWLAMAVVFYALAIVLKDQVQISTGLWKAGHITSGGYLGYWMDRKLYGRLMPHDPSERTISRAIIVAACIVGMAFGL